MHRLPLILCALALLGSAASAVLYFRIGDSKKILELHLAEANRRSAKLETDLAAANETTGALKARSAALAADLATAQTRIAATEQRAAALDRTLADTKRVLGLYEETARALAEEIAALRRDLADARASQAAPEAVEAYKHTIAQLEQQLADARNGTAAPTAPGAADAVFTSRVGRATVLTVGPENAFVVVNFGSARGAQVGQKMNLSQGTSVVATVLIRDVRTHFSVAHVVPESLRGALHKGDSAVLIR
jgi:ABC-type transporter Mla subunit MlaD